jgi:hypothetical protein
MTGRAAAAALLVVALAPCSVSIQTGSADRGRSSPSSTDATQIPTSVLAAARQRAQDKQAMSNIRNALVTEKTYYVDNQRYTVSVSRLNALEPSIDFSSADAATHGVLPAVMKVGSDPAQGICLESDSESGSKFFLVDIVIGRHAGDWYGKNAVCPTDGSVAPVGFTTDLEAGWPE